MFFFTFMFFFTLFYFPFKIFQFLLHFFLSNYLNRITDSKNRATVLSFRGLTMNLSYGIIICLYGWQIAVLRRQHPSEAGEDTSTLSNQIFAEATQWWWVYLLVIMAALAIFQKFKIGKTWNDLLPPNETESKKV